MIQLINVTKKYKNKLLYTNVNLTIKKGECIGIVGSNGSGKSVLFQLITGLQYPEEGEIYVRGKKVGKGLDFPEDVGLLVNQPSYIGYYDGLTNLKILAEIRNKITEEQIKEMMNRIGLNPDDKTKTKNYSAGMKQKLSIIQAVMEGQDIILLDEPFNALDYQTNLDVINLIEQLKEEGKTLILTSHQHNFLEKLCDRMMIIQNNQLTPLTDELKSKYFFC